MSPRTLFLIGTASCIVCSALGAGLDERPSPTYFIPSKNGLHQQAFLPLLDLSVAVDGKGLSVRGPMVVPEWETRISVAGMQRDNERSIEWMPGTVHHDSTTVIWKGGAWNVEYIASDQGIRQNFLIQERPRGTGSLKIMLDIRSSLCPEQERGNGIAFRDDRGHFRHAYRDLHVWDACGTSLASTMRLAADADQVVIAVDDRNAVYPITVDPISTTVDRILLPTLGGNFGYSVASAGDLNGDGYSDVAVGAYTASSGEASEGLVYVYYGASTGIPAAASVILQADQANASFGFSLDGAGDVNGDGFSDLAVGAQTWEDNAATNKEGAVFIFHGSAAGVSTVPAVILQSNATDNYMGYSVAGLGDINGDGYSDVGTGGFLAAYGQFNEGVAWIFLGSATGINPVFRHRLERNQTASQFGGCIAPAGDVNGDGYNDVIVGAHRYELGPPCPPPTAAVNCDQGGIFIYHGSANALGAGANPAPILTFNTQGYSVRTGWAVSTAGDVNADGYSDIIIGDWRDSVGTESYEGVAFIFHGSAAGVVTVPAATLQINQESAFFGRSVSTAGDVNGDGYADVIVGATQFSNGQAQEGASFLYLGSATGVGSSAYLRFESNSNNAQMGESVSVAGDVNGDGYSDIVLGISGQSGGGAAHIYHGGTYNVNALPGFSRSSGQTNARLGTSVANAGDVNGDGYSDAIFGAPGASNGQAGEGLAYVHYGSIAGLSAAPNVTLEEDIAGAAFGNSVASAGDVDGDGYADVIVGAPLSGGIGRAYLYMGGPAGLSAAAALVLDGTAGSGFGTSVFKAGDMDCDGFSDVIIGAPGIESAYIHKGDAVGLDPVPHVTLTGSLAGEGFGSAVCTAGDVNGDGFSDVVVGAPDHSNGQAQEGAIYVFLGDLFTVPVIPQLFWEVNIAGRRLGTSVAGAGDVNGDGFFDIIAGAPFSSVPEIDEGIAYLFFGSPAGTTVAGSVTIQSNVAAANLGTSVAEGGDVNGDGYADVVIGAPNYANGEANEGAVYVVLGAPGGIGTRTIVEENVPGGRWGAAVAGGGDVDGDGYSDAMGGAPNASPTLANEGSVFLHRGNDALAVNRLTRQYLTDLISPLSTNSADFTDALFFGVGHRARSPIQRTTARLCWEVVHEGQPFAGNPITNSVLSSANSAAWTDLGLQGSEIKELVFKQPGFYRHKWRLRVEYPMHKMIDGQRYSRWFYGYASAVGDIGVLPVELVSFEGKAEVEGNLLTWSTASESNSAYFLVERSQDGRAFLPVGSVEAAGVSMRTVAYELLDADAPSGLSYYRLRMVDRDGSEEFSDVITVLRDTRSVFVYPIPVDDVLYWSSTERTVVRAVVRDALGRVVIDASTQGNAITGASLQRLMTGTYSLILLDGQGSPIARSRFLKR
ncbi:MAG TPA: integrin alpha [Flavobacteriales bacterium]|nr:integrin alpha [Flavobacteriales bacterium]